jgi:aminomethyltransferase
MAHGERRMSEQLNKTALFDMHVAAGAKMVPFAGYDMPVQYPLGVKKEHLHTRDSAGLFDVSHMGQLRLKGDGAAAALEALVPVDIIDLPSQKQRYAFFTNEEGGIMDDLMVANFGDHLFVVVNAACKEQDIAHFVSRSGYTGEDGYEVSVPNDKAAELAETLTSFEEVEWIGLGARDSLRLECGLCLYGHDLDTTTTPVEASLLWGISKNRRADGERAGGFPGADIILKQIETKDVNRKRVGLVGQTKAPVREGCKLFDANDTEIGVITSGTAGPTAGKPVSMGYLRTDLAVIGTEVFAEVRGKKLAMTVEKMPFVPQRYYRG